MKLDNLYFLFILIHLSILTACNNNDILEQEKPAENKFLIEVTNEKILTRKRMIDIIKKELPSVKLPEDLIYSLINDVVWCSISYQTEGPSGEKIKASGIIVYPAMTTYLNYMLSVQHSTSDMENAPSLQQFCFEAAPALLGRVVVMADYIGYGTSQTPDRQHPYLHIALTGKACADMIEAAKEYFRNKKIDITNNKIDLMGYSQGGHATLATLLELERRGQAGEIDKVDAGGAPTDMVNMWKEFINGDIGKYGQSGYIPYVIRGMDYGDQLKLDPARIYAPEIIKKGITKMFSTQPLSKWHSVLGRDIEHIVHPDVLSYPDWNGNTDVVKLLEAFKRNSFVNYPAPETKVTLYHTPQDESVPFSNAEELIRKWDNITLVKLEADKHFKGGIEFFLRYLGLWTLIKEEEGDQG